MEEPRGTPNLQTKLIYAEKLLSSTLQHSSSSRIYYRLEIYLYNLSDVFVSTTFSSNQACLYSANVLVLQQTLGL